MLTKATLVLLHRSHLGYVLKVHTRENDHHEFILGAFHVRDVVADGASALALDAVASHTPIRSNGTAPTGVDDAREAEAAHGTCCTTPEAGHKDH